MCAAGGRKDESSAYLTHLSKIVTKDVALYTLFLQARFESVSARKEIKQR